jgi:14-3-3 protein epsilon
MATPDFYEKNLYLARVTEQSERYDETIKYMEEIVKNKKDDLSIEERNLLSAAYKNCVSSRRSAWRSIYGIEVKEKSNNSKYLHLVTELKTTLEKELTDLCDRMLKLIDNHLSKKASNAESKVFYLKMKGDYYRYLAEFISGDKHDQIAKSSLDSYKTANDLAKELSFTNPIKLGLALNFSVFYYEVLNDPGTACKIANEAFQEGIQHLEIIEDDQYKDSTTILQLLKENIDMWSVDLAHEGGEENMEEA